MLRPHADNLWTVDQPLRFYGLGVGTRMTVIRFGDQLWLHSPIAPSPELRDSLAELGRVHWAVAPCALHHLWIASWLDEGVEGWCAQPLRRKRADIEWTGTLEGTSPWAPHGLDMLATRSFPLNGEVVFFHRASRTLILTDLLFNFGKETGLGTRLALRAMGMSTGPQITLLERMLMKRAIARPEIEHILAWDFERVILAHGAIIETGGKDAFRDAYRWLKLD